MVPSPKDDACSRASSCMQPTTFEIVQWDFKLRSYIDQPLYPRLRSIAVSHLSDLEVLQVGCVGAVKDLHLPPAQGCRGYGLMPIIPWNLLIGPALYCLLSHVPHCME